MAMLNNQRVVPPIIAPTYTCTIAIATVTCNAGNSLEGFLEAVFGVSFQVFPVLGRVCFLGLERGHPWAPPIKINGLPSGELT